MKRFVGKRVLVTGSTRGIGRATAIRFLEEGATVILHGRKGAAVREAIAPLRHIHGNRVLGEAADLADRTQCRALCDLVGEIDILINCAGMLEDRPLEDIDDAHWHRILDVNTTAPWILARHCLHGLRKRGGVIINVSSDAGLLGYANHATYCASKGALIGLTRALAVEFAPDVRVFCVCPGPVDTDMMRAAVNATTDPVSARQDWTSYTLLRRVASPDEIATAIVFAASQDCSYATGNLIVVDGGATTGRKV